MTYLSLSEIFPLNFFSPSGTQSLGDDFSLCDNGNVVFHWADFHETCDAVKKRMINDSQMNLDFKRKEIGIKNLCLIPVWIRTNKKVHQISLYELYEKYILNQVQLSFGVDPFGPSDISFISSSGPFRSMAIAECFNSSTYKDFVMVYLIKDKLPKRDFRIRLNSKVLMEFGNNFSQAGLISLEQMTLTGLLFSLESNVFMKSLAHCSQFRVFIDTNVIRGAIDKNLSDLKKYLSQYTFNLLYSSHQEDAFSCHIADVDFQSGFDFLMNSKAYLFIPYTKFGAKKDLRLKIIKEFVSHLQDLVREHYSDKKTEKTA